jgi:hypothetical protein
MKRRTVSLSEDAVEALERLASVHDTTVSGVVEGAARLIAEGGGHADALAERLAPDRRGGPRTGAGRRRREA